MLPLDLCLRSVVPQLRYFCPKGKFTCHDLSCISIVHRCDGTTDCPNDRADEEGCPCLYDRWMCDDGTCLPKDVRCNGNIDCPNDVSDERNCNGEQNELLLKAFGFYRKF
ncbi:PREDICTED: very low-density lipoprotein receptor-like [Rhagoletis zephyria]|uniref:very low-density lipoprotein receptor-like n=1 Tax=Rhagoletis zephyria TaxID=28612 RepID=UPI0008116BD2|nr:PREDICTED: very low-density lipoprotein receptor-like [Rhagoletis zephyria]